MLEKATGLSVFRLSDELAECSACGFACRSANYSFADGAVSDSGDVAPDFACSVEMFAFHCVCPFCQETGGVLSQLTKASIQFFISAMGSTGAPAAVSQAAAKPMMMAAIRIGKILRVIAAVLSFSVSYSVLPSVLRFSGDAVCGCLTIPLSTSRWLQHRERLVAR